MSVALGLLLGVGLVLISAPLLWPRTTDPTARSRSMSRPAAALRARLVLAGLPDAPLPVFVGLSFVCAVAALGLTIAFTGLIAVSAGAGLLGLCGPTLVVIWRADLRRRRTRAVWPDIVDHLVAAVRSGLSLPDALASLATAGPPATRAEFADFGREYRATGNFSHGIERLKFRLGDATADRLLETLRMAREVGGSELAAVLVGLGRYLRSEAAVRAELEARQGWVMNAARLGAVAPWIVLALLATRPEAVDAYNSALGIGILASGAVLTVVAYRIMRAIARLPEERRWVG
ncbi:type II secretion system F family protein [Microbacteriaceae bacterium VKM Ac-2854]|nr:type II secretion system F family protein [Microbacteriaceae bacterium VKM Ac-2854]